MKKLPGYLKVLLIVFLSIVILYYLNILFHSRLFLLIDRNFRLISPNWYFIESLILRIFDIGFALTGLIAIKYYSRVKEHSEDLLYLFSIPALFPVFVFGIGIPAGFFLKSCCVIQHYSQTEHIILLVSRIVYWLFLLFIAWYVSVKLSRRYVLVFLLEYLIFLAYLAAFYAKLVGPVKLPLHIFC